MRETLNTLIGIASNEKLSLQTLIERKQKATDSLAMLSKENNYINKVRRDDVLPQLGKVIRKIKFNIPKESKTLFGEDVSKRIASVKKMRRDIRTYRSYSSTPHYYESKKSYTLYNSSSSTPYTSKHMNSFPSTQSSSYGKKNRGQYNKN